MLAGRIAFIIAHRLSTVRHATRIVVVHNGEIVESGTHKESSLRKDATRRSTGNRACLRRRGAGPRWRRKRRRCQIERSERQRLRRATMPSRNER